MKCRDTAGVAIVLFEYTYTGVSSAAKVGFLFACNIVGGELGMAVNSITWPGGFCVLQDIRERSRFGESVLLELTRKLALGPLVQSLIGRTC